MENKETYLVDLLIRCKQATIMQNMFEIGNKRKSIKYYNKEEK